MKRKDRNAGGKWSVGRSVPNAVDVGEEGWRERKGPLGVRKDREEVSIITVPVFSGVNSCIWP